jgi:hypothetical protein
MMTTGEQFLYLCAGIVTVICVGLLIVCIRRRR